MHTSPHMHTHTHESRDDDGDDNNDNDEMKSTAKHENRWDFVFGNVFLFKRIQQRNHWFTRYTQQARVNRMFYSISYSQIFKGNIPRHFQEYLVNYDVRSIARALHIFFFPSS